MSQLRRNVVEESRLGKLLVEQPDVPIEREARRVVAKPALDLHRVPPARIGVRSQADAAGSAVALAIEALRESEPSMERSDDPEEDYQLLVNATERLLFELDDGGAAIPQWAAWRICREMTALHYASWTRPPFA